MLEWFIHIYSHCYLYDLLRINIVTKRAERKNDLRSQNKIKIRLYMCQQCTLKVLQSWISLLHNLAILVVKGIQLYGNNLFRNWSRNMIIKCYMFCFKQRVIHISGLPYIWTGSVWLTYQELITLVSGILHIIYYVIVYYDGTNQFWCEPD